MSSEIVPYKEMEQMARAIAASNFFGVKTPEQAIALMLIAQAEGMHPAAAARDYNVIQGRPALKSDAMLARFQSAGGSVKWETLTDEKVSATFTHPQGGSVTIDWDMARAKAAGLASKDNYHKWPRQMLRSRVISEGIRTVYPGVLSGMYTPEEVVDFDDKPSASTARTAKPAPVPPPVEDAKVIDETPVDPNAATKEELAQLTALAKEKKHLLPDADVITLRKIIRDGCTKSVLADWANRLQELKEAA